MDGFEAWRTRARSFLHRGVFPDDVVWIDGTTRQTGLPSAAKENPSAMEADAPAEITIPARFLEVAKFAAAHTDADRYALAYRVAWRLTRGGQRALLEDAADVDVHRLFALAKAVRRDMHKMKAFVRFRRVENLQDRDEVPTQQCDNFVAWHRADYRIVRLVAPFFARRFAVMRWTIFTPTESVTWDGAALCFGDGVPAHAVEAEDELENLWKTYYRAIFNPARIKINAMKKEMPVRHWRTLPEASIIDELLRDAPRRTIEMLKNRDKEKASALPFVPPPEKRTLKTLENAARGCEGCELHEIGTQTVFGEGRAKASLMLIGEQPGDSEDKEGRPFVGPAGRVLDEAFAAAGVDRDDVYLTNAVKHFYWKPQGKRRLHAKPKVGHVRACRPWLEAEIAEVKPEVILCLGATAAQALLGSGFRVTKDGGKLIRDQSWAPNVIATIHPSAILRARDEDKDSMFAELVAAMELAKAAAN
ncbi:MAG: UdgX family uracil-DNA binding protein [Phycisphaerae bacterium]